MLFVGFSLRYQGCQMKLVNPPELRLLPGKLRSTTEYFPRVLQALRFRSRVTVICRTLFGCSVNSAKSSDTFALVYPSFHDVHADSSHVLDPDRRQIRILKLVIAYLLGHATSTNVSPPWIHVRSAVLQYKGKKFHGVQGDR